MADTEIAHHFLCSPARISNMTHVVTLPDSDKPRLDHALRYIRDWCEQHKWQVGAGEMALGAGLIAYGVQSGAVEMGMQLIAGVLDDDMTSNLLGGATGGVSGMALGVLGNIGIVAGGTAIGVPAMALALGGGLILGLAGYGVGGIVHQFLNPVPDIASTVAGTSLLSLGLILMADGARRIAGDKAVTSLVTRFTDGALELGVASYKSLLRTSGDLTQYLATDTGAFLREVATNPKWSVSTAAAVTAGAAAGSAVAASSVTVLGSQALGGLALSLGLVSAPIWPVIAGGGLALGAAYGAWKFATRRAKGTEVLVYQERLTNGREFGLLGYVPPRPNQQDGDE